MNTAFAVGLYLAAVDPGAVSAGAGGGDEGRREMALLVTRYAVTRYCERIRAGATEADLIDAPLPERKKQSARPCVSAPP